MKSLLSQCYFAVFADSVMPALTVFISKKKRILPSQAKPSQAKPSQRLSVDLADK
ncbi:hypothetical protein [Vibrio cionasavignyae]|uniref:hypothetical protein n=1 Tax=Vibrio cionasavignyae TaxID=2910252 RepID=UPI003D0B97DF